MSKKTIQKLLKLYETDRDSLEISELKKIADCYYSRYIRKRDNNTCFTCGKREKIQNGHFVPRHWSLLRYHDKNCNAQCVGCNMFKKGNLDEYAYRLQLKYGEGIIDELHALKVIHSFTYDELYEIIDRYKA